MSHCRATVSAFIPSASDFADIQGNEIYWTDDQCRAAIMYLRGVSHSIAPMDNADLNSLMLR
jgi:hypothetical protein